MGANGCDSIIYFDLTIIPLEQNAVVYPNPAFTKLYFYNPSIVQNQNMKIYDARGRLVYEGIITSETYDVSGYAKGMYVIVINHNECALPVQKWIKE